MISESSHKNRLSSDPGIKTISYIVLIIFSIIIAYPILWMFLQSFKTAPEMYQNSWGLPQGFNWENYVNAWKLANMGQYIFNSLFVSAVTVIFTLILASLAAYAFSKFSFPGSRILFYLFVFSLMLPVPIIPLYSVVSWFKLIDTYWALILPYVAGGLPLSIFLLKIFFDSLPKEIEEAARIDGCTEFKAFTLVMLPLSKPVLATVTIFTFMGAWNEFFLALIFIRNTSLRTIPLGLQAFFQEHSTDWPALFASLSMATIPIILIYIVMQKQFIEGLTSGAIKG